MFEMEKKTKIGSIFPKTYLDGIPSKVVLGSSIWNPTFMGLWWAWAPPKKIKNKIDNQLVLLHKANWYPAGIKILFLFLCFKNIYISVLDPVPVRFLQNRKSQFLPTKVGTYPTWVRRSFPYFKNLKRITLVGSWV